MLYFNYTTETTIKKSLVFALSLYLLFGVVVANSDELQTIAVKFVDDLSESPVWIGPVLEVNETEEPKLLPGINWQTTESQEVSFVVPTTQRWKKFYVLRKNFLPVIQHNTSFEDDVDVSIEFAEGASFQSKVTNRKDGTSVTEGIVSLQFDKELEIPIPVEDPIFVWDIKDDGFLNLQGLPIGEHKFSIEAPGYMRYEQTVSVAGLDEEIVFDIQLDRAVQVRGSIVDYSPNPSTSLTVEDLIVQGDIEVVLISPAQQTETFAVEFDAEKNFSIGPFAEDSDIKIRAHLPDGQRSRWRQFNVPAEEIKLHVANWILVTGTVVDKDTAQPITEFTVTSNLDQRVEIDEPNGNFTIEIYEWDGEISIVAPGYVYWTTFDIGNDELEFDLGVIELIPAHKVRGIVFDNKTGEPMEGVSITRWDGGTPDAGITQKEHWIRRWHYANVNTETNADGEFELDSFSTAGGQIAAWFSGYAQEVLTFYDVNEVLEFRLSPIGSINGQVVLLSGESTKARINYFDNEFSGGGFRTDEDGKFEFSRSAGTYSFSATADAGRSQDYKVELGVDEVVDLRIVIDIVGRVHGNIDGLMADESISISAGGAGGRFNANGTYEIIGVESGEQDIRVLTSFGREILDSIVMGESQESRFDVTLPVAKTLSGRVLAGEQGIAELEIIARPKDSQLPSGRTASIADGSYHFKALAPGLYTVEIPARSFSQSIEIHDDSLQDLHVGSFTLSGTVYGRRSVRGATVVLSGGPKDRKLEHGLRQTTDANGEYRFIGLPKGGYTIKVTHTDHEETTEKVNVNQERVKLDVYLEESRDPE